MAFISIAAGDEPTTAATPPPSTSSPPNPEGPLNGVSIFVVRIPTCEKFKYRRLRSGNKIVEKQLIASRYLAFALHGIIFSQGGDVCIHLYYAHLLCMYFVSYHCMQFFDCLCNDKEL